MNNTILSKEELDLYNYIDLRNIILEIFKLLKYLKRVDDKHAIPKITNDYRVRYEQFIPVQASAVERCALKNLMLETKEEDKRRRLLSKITVSLRKLNELELEVYNHTFYKNSSEEEIMDVIGYGRDKVREIRKSACIKFLSSMGLDTKCFKQDA